VQARGAGAGHRQRACASIENYHKRSRSSAAIGAPAAPLRYRETFEKPRIVIPFSTNC
jgi:hypothetical protein